MTASSDPRLRSLASLYSRFIPREELGAFSAWQPGLLSGEARTAGHPTAQPPAPPPPPPPPAVPAITPEMLEQQVQAAQQAGQAAGRQTGYEEGYRDGLAALESFKQRHAEQVAAQVAEVVASFQARLVDVEQQLAAALAGVATEIARQVVRRELTTQPDLVETVAQDALAALVSSARQVRVRLHPDDHALLAGRAGLDLDAHHARLIEDAAVSRGGCLVDCDLGQVDASIEARWRRAAFTVGGDEAWQPGDEGHAA